MKVRRAAHTKTRPKGIFTRTDAAGLTIGTKGEITSMRRTKTIALIVLAAIWAFQLQLSTADAFGEGSRGPDVYAVQGMLKSLGSYAGEIDGVYGPATAAGVRYFQQRYGLPVTGQVDGDTLQAILWAYAELKIPKKPSEEPKPAPQPEPEPQDEIPPLSEDEQRMIDLVNMERTKEGLSPLTADPALSRVARIKSAEMIEKDYFSHTSPTYGSPFDMMKRFGITYRTAGENLACNRSVEAAHQALMESPGHRQNILNPAFTRIGVGIVKGGMCGYMYTQMFVGDGK
jgi:uncharacterized YkwD family protein